MDRRDFIKLLGIAGTNAAAFTACSSYMSEALAQSTVIGDMLAASPPCDGSLKDIEHVVVLMQENRSFDHYYGTLRGVRGFGDPRPMKQKDGEPVWHQLQSDTTKPRIRPYRLPKIVKYEPVGDADDPKSSGNVFVTDPAHDFDTGLKAWNKGLMDQWIPAKDIISMAHYTEDDLPFYFKLAKTFTMCDAYFCSHNGYTDPNRSYFFTGTCDGRTDNSYFSNFNSPQPELLTWQSYPEKLEELRVDWKFYQDGLGWKLFGNPFEGNFGDNTLEYFQNYRDVKSALYKKNQTVNSILRTDADKPSQFETDIKNDALPPISWIVPPEAFTEHPSFPPHLGEFYLHEILRALIANPVVWHKTVLLINYDENGGFFDHVLPPTPPLDSKRGQVTPGIILPATTKVPDKDLKKLRDINAEQSRKQDDPIGMGMRVPMLVISPWSVGGRVCSEVFDHTSVLRFLDTWLTAKGKQRASKGVFTKTNTSSWRQAIAGDLTSAFDFSTTRTTAMDKVVALDAKPQLYTNQANATKLGQWPGGYKPYYHDIKDLPDQVNPVAAKQDRTRCEILPLKYNFQVLASFIETADGVDGLQFTFKNTGSLGVAFTHISYDREGGGHFYSLEGVKGEIAPIITLTETFTGQGDLLPGRKLGDYASVIYGPNGYLAEFKGNSADNMERLLPDIIDVRSVDDGKTVQFTLAKWPSANGKLKAINAYGGAETIANPDTGKTTLVNFATDDGWYDVSFVDANNSSRYQRRYAGHLENGKISRSDPAIGMNYDETKRVYVSLTA